MNLASVQRIFWELLRGEERPLDAFVGTAELPARERVGIYARMFVDRQVDALRETFPKVVGALGDEPFHAIAAKYVHEHPSEHPDLGQIGRHFAGFLQRADLADLARLEWARGEVFEAPAGESLSPDDFAALAQDPAAFMRRQVRLIPAVKLLHLGHDVNGLWEGSALSAEARAMHVVVWRSGFEVFHVEVDASEARSVELALNGAALGDVCGALEEPERAAEMLQGWLGEGWLAA
jgi:hypothetical protein